MVEGKRDVDHVNMVDFAVLPRACCLFNLRNTSHGNVACDIFDELIQIRPQKTTINQSSRGVRKKNSFISSKKKSG